MEQATRIVLIRHGETAWNRATRIQGHTDVPLSPLGLAQAERVAEALAEEPFAAIYSSDLSRARQTAQALARIHELDVRLDAGLRERAFGRFEGLSWSEIDQGYPEDAARWRRREPDFAVGGGESLISFSERCLAAARRAAAAHPGQSIALVAHGGVLDCLYRAATRAALDTPRSWLLGNATINRLLATVDGFTLVGWNDDRHLAGLSADDMAA
ncbi:MULTISPECIES: histidine phosphatase family protein [Roseateles]|uniref:Histidine phosphatase family protein n=1 Tax=Pelomonas caseinilytica TaxID=2906763 RepID=A0ABS8XLR9_9BURK|nr:MULTISPECIES: histidine phosphatase family protein [unclassified Roseateles]MCE4539608.1 histidine phosphatase family protein [Pelomonas sp. P7]HEV6964901.1 histidine phosphatase family protein [Roseateles sp.]